jgi:hypothetical protein
MRKEDAGQLLYGLLHSAYSKNGGPVLIGAEAREALKYGIQVIHCQPDFQKLGRKGGLATKAAHKPDYFRRIGKLGGRPSKKKEQRGKGDGLNK